ncbi:MAG: HEAT repeat domain-containing protein [Thermoguttaceae bacterium]
MSFPSRRFLDRAFVAAWLLTTAALPGCQWFAGAVGPGLPFGEDQQQTAGEATAAAADRALSDAERSVLAGDSWILAVPRDNQRQGRIWRNPGLEDLLARPVSRQVDLLAALCDSNPVVSANAAIGLARKGNAAGAERLAEAVRSPNAKLPMRLAATEALGELSDGASLSLLGELLDQYGDYRNETTGNYTARLHAELIRALAKRVDPTTDQRFIAASRSPSADVRLEAIRAWGGGRQGSLPLEVTDLRADGDYRVRAAALHALATRRHPQAHAHLAAALRDTNLHVRTAAVEALGILGGPEAIATLKGMLENQPELIRATAVAALAACGVQGPVIDAADDESWRVRMKVAEALGEYADRQGTTLASQLLADPSVQVQHKVIAAVGQWPLEQAGPVLLSAMDRSGYMLRKLAAEQLARRWPPAGKFPIDGPPQRRAEELARLRDGFRQRWGFADRNALTAASQPASPAGKPSPQLVDRVEQLVNRRDIAALAGLGPAVTDALEQLVFDRRQVLPEVVYRDVLAKQEPAFAALKRLQSSNLVERRRAINELVDLSSHHPLRRLVVARLAEIVAAESDQLVWQSALSAVAVDGSEPSIRLARAAISHPMPEVRRRACVHLGAHASPRHAGVLAAALNDSSQSVACAAARALGACGNPEAVDPLKRLLADGNEQLRLETALALVRLGDPAGTAAMERLTYSSDPKIRYQVVTGIGSLGQSSFSPLLIRMLDDGQVGVRRAALAGLAEVAGRDISDSADGLPVSTEQRIERWKQWYFKRASRR